MASLSEQIDRLAKSTRGIDVAAQAVAGPSKQHSFTHAVLKTPLGDLIRDIDTSELGLFSLVTPHTGQEREKAGRKALELARNEFQAATPLRRLQTRRDDGDPEGYAHAALKYIHRYETVRAMPRAYAQVADIIDQLEQTRLNIQELTQAIEQNQATEGASLRATIEQEEQEIRELEQKVAESKKLRDARKTVKPTSRLPKQPKRPITPVTAPDLAEESFWSTPTTTAKAGEFNLSDNLMNEDVDFGNTSTLSMSSPPPPSIQASPTPQSPDDRSKQTAIIPESSLGDVSASVDVSFPSIPQSPTPESHRDTGDKESPPETPGTMRRMRINAEVERISAKIWATMGDVIMPGHPFQSAGPSTDVLKPPRAKETIAHLRSVASSIPCPSSPSDTSLSSATSVPSQPTSQQVLTAHLLVTLLSSPPTFSLSLNKVKEVLTAKATSCGNPSLAMGQGATRIVYNCVAKRLIKIERGGGEQTVKFSV